MPVLDRLKGEGGTADMPGAVSVQIEIKSVNRRSHLGITVNRYKNGVEFLDMPKYRIQEEESIPAKGTKWNRQ